MKNLVSFMLLIVLVALVSGCTSTHYAARYSGASPSALLAKDRDAAHRDRMLIWQAWLSLEVASISNAVDQVAEIARTSQGYVESQSDSEGRSAHLTLRVPVESMKSTVSSLEKLGKVTSRRITSKDVTEQYVDTAARVKTITALRDRLQALLNKAKDVKEVLAIEKELGRIQANIDAMEARLKALKGKVDLVTINVSISRKRILGPLGYTIKGAWWIVEKLFIIQE